MNSALLIQCSAWLLVLTAAGGLVMAFIRFGREGKNPPSWLAMLHGFLAAAGVTLLAFAGLSSGMPGTAWAGLVLLLLAAGGGVIMNLGYHVQAEPLPKWLVGVHSILALVGVVLVVLAARGMKL